MINENTQYGFKWGALTVERYCSDEQKGWVYMGVRSPKQHIEIYCTKTGKIRVYRKTKKGNLLGSPVELK